MSDIGNASVNFAVQGWIGSPTSRGTFDILSSCLVAILASTWTILHLNVPAANDSKTKKFFRKLKWMCFTIMFPEFMFAHAMEERLMANFVLAKLKEVGVKVKPTGRRKFAVASTIGNLEWRNLLDFLAGSLHLRKFSVEGPSEDAPTWLQRLPGIQNMTKPSQQNVTSVVDTVDQITEQGQLANTNTDLASTTPKHPQQDEARAANGTVPIPSPPSEQGYEWTITHAIFANMGGFRLASKIPKDRDVTRRELRLASQTYRDLTTHRTIDGFELASLLVTGEISSVPDISKEHILDKSKTDTFARWLAILQCLWLLLELIARQIEGLPSSQLEIATLAFACCSILTYIAVRDKPKDVDIPLEIPIGVPLPKRIPLDALFERQKSFFLEVFVFKYWQPKTYESVIPGPMGTKAWRFNRRKRHIAGLEQAPVGRRISNDNYLVQNYISHPMAGWMVIGSIVFGGIHCIAWNHYFPTRTERILWRTSELVTTLAPLLLPIIDRGANTIRKLLGNFGVSRSTFAIVASNGWTIIVPTLVLLSYVLLRMCIVVLVFASLREMPAGVYHTTWTKYLLSVH